jgi:hypothetical protein
VINDNVMLYVTNVCFAETNGKLGRITDRSTYNGENNSGDKNSKRRLNRRIEESRST